MWHGLHEACLWAITGSSFAARNACYPTLQRHSCINNLQTCPLSVSEHLASVQSGIAHPWLLVPVNEGQFLLGQADCFSLVQLWLYQPPLRIGLPSRRVSSASAASLLTANDWLLSPLPVLPPLRLSHPLLALLARVPLRHCHGVKAPAAGSTLPTAQPDCWPAASTAPQPLSSSHCCQHAAWGQ